MISKKLRGFLMKIEPFISYYFSKKTHLCLPLPQEVKKKQTSKQKKHFPMKVNIKKFL